MSSNRPISAMAGLYARTVVASRRSLIAGLLWLLPMIFFVISALRASGDAASRLELWRGFQFIGPLGFLVQFYGLFYGLAVISEELENGTLPYLLVRPIPRSTIVLARFAAASLFIFVALTSMNVLLLVLVRPAALFKAFLAAEAAALLGTVAYTAFFACLATLFRKPLAPALLFLIAIDFGLSLAPIAVHNVAPKYHLLQFHAWLIGSDANDGILGGQLFSASAPSPLVSTGVLVAITLVCLAVTLRRFTRAQFSA